MRISLDTTKYSAHNNTRYFLSSISIIYSSMRSTQLPPPSQVHLCEIQLPSLQALTFLFILLNNISALPSELHTTVLATNCVAQHTAICNCINLISTLQVNIIISYPHVSCYNKSHIDTRNYSHTHHTHITCSTTQTSLP